MIIELKGRIDSNNAPKLESDVFARLKAEKPTQIVMDAADLAYISSAGLRLILRVKKRYADLRIINVNADVYDILEMTGFTEMMTVEKAYRTISIEGCDVIGSGSNGNIYRIDDDTVVKVYNNTDALEEIQHEREVAKLALILGIPTAISYDVVRVGERYGAVFELLNARTFSEILASEPDRMDWCAEEYVSLLKKIHGTLVPEGKLPDMKERARNWASFTRDYLPEEAGNKLETMIDAVPHDDHMLHGDYHTRNVVVQGDEVLLIDMDTLAIGCPVFELGSMYNSFVGYSEVDHDTILHYQGFDLETGKTFWRRSLAAYLGTTNERKLREVEDKARIVGYTRGIRRSIRRGGLDSEKGRAEIDFWKSELLELLDKYDTLLFVPNELELEAVQENLEEVQSFVDEHLEAAGCSVKAQMQIGVAVEEIFINISSYAYNPDTGKATVRVAVSDEPVVVTITFLDHGVPYDPLAKQDPDVSMSAEEREIGGLGIFMTKSLMDDVSYEYIDGENILTLKKNL